MKKSILVLSLSCFYFLNASAQIDKNGIYPELSIGRKVFNYNSNSFQTGVSIGLNNHSTLGVFYSRTKTAQFPSPFSESSSTVNRFGVSYSYYSFFKRSKKWGWLLTGSASINRGKMYYKPSGATGSYNERTDKELMVTPGLFFKPSARVMLTANIGGFSLYNSQHPVGTSYSSFGGELNLGIRINLFGKKNK